MFRIKRILKLVFDEFIYGGHLQSLGAASIVFVSALLLKLKVSWDILLITYLIFYPLYLYNRFREIDVDYLTNPQRTQHLRKYIKFIPVILCLAIFILAISLLYFSNLRALIFGLFLLVFGIFYTAVFKEATKKIFFFKDIYVSIFFTSLPFFLIIYYSFPLTISLIVSASSFSLFVFLKSFLMQIFLDIKDVESDKEKGFHTFPIMVGREKSLTVLSIFNFLISISVPIVLSLYLNVFPKLILMLIFTVPFSFYCYNLVKREKHFGYILQSGEFLLWAFLVLIGKIIL